MAPPPLGGPEHAPALRVAGHSGSIYLDLADAEGRCIKVTADGWAIDAAPPLRFLRPATMRSLPEPDRAGSLDDLCDLLNIGSEEDCILVVAWLVGTLRPGFPFPILLLQGEHGSAKTTTSRLLRMLIDPAEPLTRSAPREEHDLLLQAQNDWIIVIDNLSGLRPQLSDALCRLSSGGRVGRRRLYSSAYEVTLRALRPVIVNGIGEFATRPDLLDRAIQIMLPPIAAEDRLSESDVWQKFAELRPRILGGLLDALVEAVRHVDQVRLASTPRMADFARWLTAAEGALPWQSGRFVAAYEANRRLRDETAVEATPVGPLLIEFARSIGTWQGTRSELLTQLRDMAGEQRSELPRQANKLAQIMNRIAPNLRALDVQVETLPRTRWQRPIRITFTGTASATPGAASREAA